MRITEAEQSDRVGILLGLTRDDVASRRNYVGASDANILMSGDLEKIQKLWEEKVGLREPEDLSDVLLVQLGIWNEAFSLAWFTKQTGCAVFNRNTKVLHPELPFLRATLDGETVLECGTPAVIDAKGMSPFGFDLEEACQKYGPQMAVQMACKNVDKAVLSILIGNTGYERPVLERDPIYETKVLKACSDFWEHVKNRTPPTELHEAKAPLPHGLLKKVDMSFNNEWMSYEISYLMHEENAKTFEEAKKTLKTLVAEDVGEAKGKQLCIKRSKSGSLLFSKVKT
jgi:predicted phage-related endonuclease